MTSNRGLSCIVISSASEKSFSFAVRRSMTGNTNGKPAPQERFGHRPFYTRREASLRLSLPPRGRGTASAVDRVLSLAVICAKTFFHLHHPPFIPLVPYLPLRGTFPSRGRLMIRGKPAIKRLSGIAIIYTAAKPPLQV